MKEVNTCACLLISITGCGSVVVDILKTNSLNQPPYVWTLEIIFVTTTKWWVKITQRYLCILFTVSFTWLGYLAQETFSYPPGTHQWEETTKFANHWCKEYSCHLQKRCFIRYIFEFLIVQIWIDKWILMMTPTEVFHMIHSRSISLCRPLLLNTAWLTVWLAFMVGWCDMVVLTWPRPN